MTVKTRVREMRIGILQARSDPQILFFLFLTVVTVGT